MRTSCLKTQVTYFFIIMSEFKYIPVIKFSLLIVLNNESLSPSFLLESSPTRTFCFIVLSLITFESLSPVFNPFIRLFNFWMSWWFSSTFDLELPSRIRLLKFCIDNRILFSLGSLLSKILSWLKSIKLFCLDSSFIVLKYSF